MTSRHWDHPYDRGEDCDPGDTAEPGCQTRAVGRNHGLWSHCNSDSSAQASTHNREGRLLLAHDLEQAHDVQSLGSSDGGW